MVLGSLLYMDFYNIHSQNTDNFSIHEKLKHLLKVWH
jgi:hypothetical protein